MNSGLSYRGKDTWSTLLPWLGFSFKCATYNFFETIRELISIFHIYHEYAMTNPLTVQFTSCTLFPCIPNWRQTYSCFVDYLHTKDHHAIFHFYRYLALTNKFWKQKWILDIQMSFVVSSWRRGLIWVTTTFVLRESTRINKDQRIILNYQSSIAIQASIDGLGVITAERWRGTKLNY